MLICIDRESWSSSVEAVMLHHHDFTVAQKRQTKLWLYRGPFTFFMFSEATMREGDARGIHLVAICNIAARCH